MAPKVLVTRHIGSDALRLIYDAGFDVVLWSEDRAADRSWILANAPGCEGILVTLNDKVDAEVLDTAGPSLKIVSTMSVGYEHVHLPALQARNVKLGYTPDVLTDAVADVAIMLALMAGRNALQGLNIVQSGQWPSVGWAPFGFCGPQLGPGPTSEPFTAGFLGFGRISQATVHRLVPFGITHVIYSDSGRGPRNEVLEKEIVERYRVFGKLEEVRRVDIDELATQSDVIFLLAPGGESTYHIINRAFLHKMKKTAILVNPGRGTLVDSDALAEALNNDWLYAAALDVIEGEPNITKDHPLLKCPRATILPHVGSASTQARAAMADLAARNLIAGVKGEALITPLD